VPRIHRLGLTSNTHSTDKGEKQVRSQNRFLALAIMFFVFADAFSVIFWSEVSLAARIGMYVLGLGSGVTFGNWLSRKEA
jgi:hypothetical protein